MSANLYVYGGPQVSHANEKAMTHKQKPWHANKSQGTKTKATAQKQKPRHKRKSHGTKEKTHGTKNKSHGTKTKVTAQKKKPRHKSKSDGTKEKKQVCIAYMWVAYSDVTTDILYDFYPCD